MIIRNHIPEPLVLTEAQKQSLSNGSAAKIEGRSTEKPSLLAKAKHASQATLRVAMAAAKGEPIRLSPEVKAQRLVTCRACEYWNEGGNVGLGECTHGSCGCTRFKHGLATETCPIGKWPQ